MRCSNLTPDIINKLITIAGAENILLAEDDKINYSRDEAPFCQPSIPDMVIKPTNTDIVSQVMRIAYQHIIPVTPRGGGTGLSGGCVPIYGGILLSMENMNHIININRDNFTAIVEPGVTLEQLNQSLERELLQYPVHIGQMTATIGGNVATNAGGLNAVKYGTTRHHVIGLEIVLPNGEIIHTGGEYIKNTTGYDLTQLLIGSEGTLAIITKIILRLSPKRRFKEIFLISFDSLERALDLVPILLNQQNIPCGIEFFDRDVVKYVERYTGYELPDDHKEAFLMVIFEDDIYERILKYFSEIEAICQAKGEVDIFVADTEHTKRKLIDFREKMNPALSRLGPWQVVDAVVPRDKIAAYFYRIKQISHEFDIPVFAFGHAGDGNVHLHPTCISGCNQEKWLKNIPLIMQKIYEECVKLGGTISGEHGIGIEKKKYLQLAIEPSLLQLMRDIKKTFDPKNVLNPGKIFDII